MTGFPRYLLDFGVFAFLPFKVPEHDSENSDPPILAISALHQDHPILQRGWLPLPLIFQKIRKNDPSFDVSLGPYGGGGSSISFSAAHSKGFWYKFSAMTVPEKGPGGGVIGFCTPVREILRPNQGIISP